MRTGIVLLATIAATLALASAALASPAQTGQLYHDGAIVGTVVVSAPVPAGSGLDPFYKVTNGVQGQLGIAGVAPGDGPYHGGDWAVYTVTFQAGVTPYLLTSDEAVAAAVTAGDVLLTRVPEGDFRCPVTSTAVSG
jgi:hypothetical protein